MPQMVTILDDNHPTQFYVNSSRYFKINEYFWLVLQGFYDVDTQIQLSFNESR